MFDKGKALLLWALECQPEMEAEWNEWYNLEHFAALVQVPGFISGNRFEKKDEAPLPNLPPLPAMPLYLTFYDLLDEGVLDSEAYHVNRGSRATGMRPEWTKRMFTYVTRVTGGTYRPLTDPWLAGSETTSDTVWALFLNPVDGQESAVDQWYQEELLPSLQSSGAITACRLFGSNDVSPDVKVLAGLTRAPRRIVLTSLPEGSAAPSISPETWVGVRDEISSAAGVLYRGLAL